MKRKRCFRESNDTIFFVGICLASCLVYLKRGPEKYKVIKFKEEKYSIGDTLNVQP